ncbi:MAG: hypothetical protein LPJ98_16390 [Cyclobacteriaceae bacterium]|nr:hypothetical protein [Cyclobacteriaceae bacterium]
MIIKHIIWVILHVLMYFAFPGYGCSITILGFVLWELIIKTRGNKKYELIHFYYLGLIIVGLSNLSIIYRYENGDDLMNFPYAEPGLFPVASLIFALGTQFLGFGYELFRNAKFPEIYLRMKLNSNLVNGIFYLTLLFALKGFWLFFSFPGSIQTVVEFFPIVGVFILSRLAGKYQKTSLFVKAILCMVAVSFNALLFAYLRVEMLLPVLVFLIGYFLGARNLKKLLTVKLIPIFLVISLFYSFFELFGEKRSQIGVGLDRITQLSSALDSEGDIFNQDDTNLSAFDRSSNIPQISAVCGLVVDNGYYNGTTLAPLFVAFIPRFIWPEKPAIALGVWFALQIGEAVETDDWFNNSINMTIPGQLFLDYGWFGLAIGSTLTGILLKLLWGSVGFYQKRFNLLGTYFGVYLLITAFLGLGADLQIIVTFLALYLLLWFISINFKKRNEDTMHRSHLARK